MYTTSLIQNYLRTCSVLIVMVLALGVMVEEAADNGWTHSLVDGSFCNTHLEDLNLAKLKIMNITKPTRKHARHLEKLTSGTM